MAHQHMNLLISTMQDLTRAYIKFIEEPAVSDNFIINLINTGRAINNQTDEIIAQIGQVHQDRKSKKREDSRYRTIKFPQQEEPSTSRTEKASKMAAASHLQKELEQQKRIEIKNLKAKISALRARNRNPM